MNSKAGSVELPAFVPLSLSSHHKKSGQRMEKNDFKHFSEDCFRDLLPPCTCACPLEVDVRGMMEKAQRGNFTSAYRLFRNQTVFPGIVSKVCDQPCRAACVRKNQPDESIFLRTLEAACVQFTRDREPIHYNVPKKNFTIAVIGAGLSGLTCALKLAGRNYAVSLFQRSDKVGGRLWDSLEPEAFLYEIEEQFSAVECDMRLAAPVDSLNAIKADAVYIATGGSGADFGLLEGVNRDSLGTTKPGVFLGGGLLTDKPLEAIAHGLRAADSIEAFLKTGSMGGAARQSRQPVDERFYARTPAPAPSAASGKEILTSDEAVTESQRCLRCNCAICYQHCELMERFNAYPKKITTDVGTTLNVIEGLTDRKAQRLIGACTLCGLCKRVCPASVDMETCLRDARRVLHRQGALPAAFHDFFLRDMAFSNEDAYALHAPMPEAPLLFFPGCQLGASDPAYVEKSYAWLLEKHPGTALLLACCSVPADWAGDEILRDSVLAKIRADWERVGKPPIVLACPTCRKTFRSYFPECETLSLFDLLALDPPKARRIEESTASVYDPCSSRYDPDMRKSVRTLAEQAGLSLEELDVSGENARCCGFGGHIYSANPDQVRDIVSRRVSLNEREFITYCANCRDLFTAAGKPCRHILDVLFTDTDSYRKPPSLTQRRGNRLALKARYAGPVEAAKQENPMDLHIPAELTEKMNRLLILEDDARAAIAHCEATGEKLLDPASGWFTGHVRRGIITYWVTYEKTDAGFHLRNIYSHRLAIEE